MDKKGQVAIFVIIAVFVVAVIALFLFAKTGKPIISTGQEFSPERFIGDCVREAVGTTVDEMIPKGGPVNPKDYRMYNNTKVSYWCRNVNYFDPCINQYPRYIYFLGKELKDNIQGDINSCADNLRAELERRNYDVKGTLEVGNMNVELKKGVIDVTIPSDLTLSKNGATQHFSQFKTITSSPLYNFGLVAQEITSQEAQFCYFEYAGYTLLYPEFDISVYSLSDSTKIYTIKDTRSGKSMHGAIRGCAQPVGF